MFYSLDEAASRLTDLCKDAHPSFRGEVTSAQLLNYGIADHLLICIPLDEDAHSPRWQNKDSDHEYRIDGTETIVRLYGLYLVPPRTLFALELAEHTNLVAVFSLDGSSSFMLGKKIAREDLRVRDVDLLAFFRSLTFPSGGAQPAPIKKKRKDALSKEIDSVLIELPDAGPEVVLAKLRERVGNGTIDRCSQTLVTWINDEGTKREADLSALSRRLNRFRGERN